MTKIWHPPAAWALCGSARAQDACETLRSEIEAKIRANGVVQFTVAVVDANTDTTANGQVVGACAQGARKIVYERQDGIAPSAAPPRRAQDGEPVLTECKDGTVTVGGDCRR